MDPRTSTTVERYRQACDRFSRAVREAGATARWDTPSPCAGWDARAVVEHVIGFHKVLVLDPLGADVRRPRADPVARWDVTSAALLAVIDDVDDGLTATLTTELLVHTWDLARAVGVDDVLDPELCAAALDRAMTTNNALRASGLFADPVHVADDVDVQTRLLALLGRKP
jgi:uncharacterized protein (TIGR03083 family)